jgi:hypothetical protein
MVNMADESKLLKKSEFDKLTASIDWSNRQLEYAKRKRIEAIKQFVGYHYAQDGSQRRIPTPFLKLAVNIYIRSLAARAPRALVTTLVDELKPTAANLELAINKIPDEIGLQDTLRRLVMEALFSFGVAKCGLYTTSDIMGHAYGSSFVDVVTLDDFCIDMSAKHLSQIQYIGDDYWLNYDDVKESKWFDEDKIKKLKADEYKVISYTGGDRAEGIVIDSSGSLYKDKIWLRDVWLPDDGLMITYAITSKELLKVIEWTGPKNGPYYVLGFDDVPGNLLPLPPVAAWRDLHELANGLFRKLGNQADSEKTVLGFSGGDEEGVKAFKAASDGDGILYSGAAPSRLQAGGVNSNTLLFYMQCKDLISYFANNLDSLGGLSPQSPTLGQDKLIAEASSSQLRDMAGKVIDFCRNIFKALAYYEWNDPVRKRNLEKPIPGTDLSITVPWSKKTRKGKFSSYDLDIDVYSLQDNSPATKLQKLNMIMQQYVMPLMPAIQQAQGQLNVQEVFEMIAKYADFDELKQLVTFVEQISEPGQPMQEPGMPANTTRTVERVNRPNPAGADRAQLTQQLLSGGGLQRPQGTPVGLPA